jgi:hypothetical protein
MRRPNRMRFSRRGRNCMAAPNGASRARSCAAKNSRHRIRFTNRSATKCGFPIATRARRSYRLTAVAAMSPLRYPGGIARGMYGRIGPRFHGQEKRRLNRISCRPKGGHGAHPWMQTGSSCRDLRLGCRARSVLIAVRSASMPNEIFGYGFWNPLPPPLIACS